ncbi:hypothetical protein [Roseobacter sp. HKCCA0434]|uniref:hypothetical protein n=1 Tax=Roseobacter sp. HKCCA0434 TaxID=3079297 RepID=UPI002905F645|nr:hypothetical protein [Roseobacter sp. HKCCA0434]
MRRYIIIIAAVLGAALTGWAGYESWQWLRRAPLRAVEAANAALYTRMTEARGDWAQGCSQAALTPALTDNVLPYSTFSHWGIARSDGVACTQDTWLAVTCTMPPGGTVVLTRGMATTGLINTAGSARIVLVTADAIGCLAAD